ncbi:MAG: Xaa-Pro peptidase family protein [Anaerolineae bacterium]
MADRHRLVREKLDQAVGILNELDIDAWMTFVRETSLSPDPSLELILGMDMVWQSAFIVTRDGLRAAIVGKHDAENVVQTGGYTRVVPYLQGIREALISTLLEINPRQLALNYSENDVAADGLAHGLMLLLQRYLVDTNLSDRFISAEPVIRALRGRKSPLEIELIQAAIATTQGIFKKVGEYVRHGMSEKAIADYVHSLVRERSLGTAWDWDYCPTVSAGPDSPIGHAGPQEQYHVGPGMLLHMDFGVKQDDYCADLQRVWYVRREGEDSPPPEVSKAFDAARSALLAGFEALRPGVQGWEVDQAARAALVAAGYPEYPFAFGHHLGRVAHDGATVLGPRWERYGSTPYGVIEAGNVFAIELGVEVPGYGYIGLEENVLVTETGAAWLSEPEETLWLL